MCRSRRRATWANGREARPRPARAASAARGARPAGLRPADKHAEAAQDNLGTATGAEAALDAALDLSYERFRRGEITATELHRERDQLVEAFNRVVMRENIRYRSMLRGRPIGLGDGALEPGRLKRDLAGRELV